MVPLPPGLHNGHWSLPPPLHSTTKFVEAINTLDPRTASNVDPSTRNILKYVTNNNFTNSGAGSTNNPRILRYADVLLLKAEAIVQSGGSLEDAIVLVNQVRGRANAMNPDLDIPQAIELGDESREEVMGIIRNERLIELFAEGGHRWLDLRRWHLGGQIDLMTWDFDSNRDDFNFQEKNVYFAVPLNELDLNPNAQPTPGY